MARKIRSSPLEARTARLRLPVSRKPLFVRIADGVNLGYRRNQTAGTWICRLADGKGGMRTKAVGTADDYDESDGATILTFWQAQDRAKAVAAAGFDAPLPPSESPAPVIETATTLRIALSSYEADLKIRGGDAGNAVRVRRHLTDAMLDRPVVDLSLSDLRTWRDGLTAKRRRKPSDAATEEPGEPLALSGVNRLATVLKAALNLAADMDARIASRRAWELGLATLPDAEEARNVILSDADIRRLVTRAPTQGADFGLLVEGLAVTGARVSQLARADIRDLQDDRPDPRIMVPSSAKGRGVKAVLRRPVPISADFAKRLRKAAEGRPADGPLFPKGDGRWKHSDHSRPFAMLVKAARIETDDGEPVTSYALRHSSIVRGLLASVPIRVVASHHDTSVAMIEKNYSRFITDHTDAMARAAMLLVTPPAASAADEAGETAGR